MDTALPLALNDNCYDVVLVFGPMDHLPPEEREQVFQSSYRICKDNGIVAFAYANKVGVYIRGCLGGGSYNIYPNKQANDSLLNQGTDDIQSNVLFFAMPEEMEQSAKSICFIS